MTAGGVFSRADTASVCKGALAGAGTAIAIGALLMDLWPDGDRLGPVLHRAYVDLALGLAAGAALGWLAGRLARRRRLVLAGIACSATQLALGMGAAGLALAPIAGASALLLEGWTRTGRVPASSVWRGVAVGAGHIVAAAVAAALLVEARVPPALLALSVLYAGLLPAVASGAALGWLAEQLGRHAPLLRRGALTIVGLVLAIGLAWSMGGLALVAPVAIVTPAAVLLLERWTRRVELPQARAL